MSGASNNINKKCLAKHLLKLGVTEKDAADYVSKGSLSLGFTTKEFQDSIKLIAATLRGEISDEN